MRRMFLASLSVVLAIGCAQAPSDAPLEVGSNTTDLEISFPESSATDAAASERLVSINVTNMH